LTDTLTTCSSWHLPTLPALLPALAVPLPPRPPAAIAPPTPPPGQLPRFLPCSPACATGLPTVTPSHIHAAATGGMPGWQITLIAIGAALLAAATTLLLDRAWIARRHATATVA